MPIYPQRATVTTSPEIAKLLAGNFIERRDVKAIQLQNGDYQPHRVGPQPGYSERPLAPFDLASLTDHVDDRHTYGHYMVKPETNTARCFVFDIDLNQKSPYHDPDLHLDAEINPREIWSGPTTTCKRDLALQLFAIAQGLAIRSERLGVPKVIVSYSGNKGLHVIGVLGPGTPAVECRELALQILESCQCFEPLRGNNFFKHSTGYPSLDIEVYPKQDKVELTGFGNLVRLPLGINRKSGRKSFFLRMDTKFGEFVIDDPLETLERGSLRA